MNEALLRRDGTIKYTNLTRTLKPGDEPETEFVYVILENMPSLEGNQVYIPRDNIIDGDPEKFTDGMKVNFLPVKVSEEKFQAALDAGKPIRRYFGMDVVLTSNSSDSSENEQEANADEQEPAVATGESEKTQSKATATENTKNKKPEQKTEYFLSVDVSGSNSFGIIGKINGKPAPLTYAISSTGMLTDKPKFKMLNRRQNFSFKSSHPGFEVEDGGCAFEVTYEGGSIDIQVRCLESYEIRNVRLRK